MLPHHLADPSRDRFELISTKARGDQDDASVLGVRCDCCVSQGEKVDDVGGDDRASVFRGIRELSAIVELNVAHFVGADRVDAVLLQDPGDVGREIFIEVDFHRVVMKRTSPGYCFSISSGVSSVFASIWRWTSSEYRLEYMSAAVIGAFER